MRAGDHVHHKPSGEDWLVAWADHTTGYMSPCGWPTCQALISDCVITHEASDGESHEITEQLRKSGRSDANKASALAQEDGR